MTVTSHAYQKDKREVIYDINDINNKQASESTRIRKIKRKSLMI